MLHKLLVDLKRERLQQIHFLVFEMLKKKKITVNCFLYSFITFFFFFFADYCQCQSITVLASVSLLIVASIYMFQCVCCSGVTSLSLRSQMDINLDAGASK